jgi:hypothetical protein
MDNDNSGYKYDLPTLRLLSFAWKPSAEQFLEPLFAYRDIYDDILDLSKEINNNTRPRLVEKIRLITEFIIWGEKHNDAFFE